ncbi:hypothetical protein LOZ12_003745 [Ophidiomyces ophidiicola]|nr:hypothetical protein LOZ62_004805 [Ophidiomyces ophidiicola]KAI2048391.1 hypothetical protein LOZ38_004359 [Ophidiomyces ophidiicola]KAI2051193.1 hypothetical protein LOZ44_003256 [Ophidiomyces ophidiicola]KAI2073337.1 hypothetical protein LOZ39_004023 [Ophidiomyces ophidiicola]KAI2075571.1 hypothetical protein LOZ37_003485 [Ophidiomyces ophidiicola]
MEIQGLLHPSTPIPQFMPENPAFHTPFYQSNNNETQWEADTEAWPESPNREPVIPEPLPYILYIPAESVIEAVEPIVQPSIEESFAPDFPSNDSSEVRPADQFSHVCSEPDEHTEMVRWAVSNSELYARSKAEWVSEFRVFCRDQFNREIVHPDRILTRLIKDYRFKEVAREKGSGWAIDVTDLDQALSTWLEFIEDLESQKRLEKESKQAEKEAQLKSRQRLQE